jgi:hypothetical protein
MIQPEKYSTQSYEQFADTYQSSRDLAIMYEAVLRRYPEGLR